MEKIICPYCEKDLTEDAIEKASRGEDIVHCTIGGSASIIGSKKTGFTFAMITCPFCNKILGAVNSSPIPVP
jgi:hypothetical protein